MKNQFLRFLTAIALTSTMAHARTGEKDGGGGNGSPRQKSYIADIKQAIKVQPFFQEQVYKAVKRQAKITGGDGSRSHYAKIVEDMAGFPNDEAFVRSVKYSPQNQPCISEGQESDSSAVFPNTVCVSINRLMAREYAPEEVLARVTALATHEIAHLMKIPTKRHYEIKGLQSHVESIVGRKSPRDLLMAYIKLHNNLSEELSFMGLELNKHNTLAGLCAAASFTLVVPSMQQDRMDEVGTFLTTGAPLGTKAKTLITEMNYRLLAAIITGCGMYAPPLLGQIEKLFEEKDTITAFDITFATNHEFTRISRSDFESKECGVSFDCEGEKKILIKKVTEGDALNLNAELFLVQKAYTDYYKIVKRLADQAEKINETLYKD